MKVTPPKDLGARGRALWSAVASGYGLDPAEMEILHELARSVDEIEALAAALATVDPIVTGSTGQPRVHPIYAELRNHRKVADRLAAALALPIEGEQFGRRRSPQAKAAVNTRWQRAARYRTRTEGGA
jgi:hypothetical protein